MKITILGSGTSTGVPQVGCTCEVCRSTDARDNRLRCSGLVEADGVRILIDCGPDFRQQMLRLDDYRPIDGVLITHEHYDHVGGLDDLRPFCHFRDIPVYAESDTAERLKRRIPYCFTEHLYPGVPHIPLEKIAEEQVLQLLKMANALILQWALRLMLDLLWALGVVILMRLFFLILWKKLV